MKHSTLQKKDEKQGKNNAILSRCLVDDNSSETAIAIEMLKTLNGVHIAAAKDVK